MTTPQEMEQELEPEAVQPEADGASETDKAIEARARRMGWRPKDEYNGPASRWVTAHEFIAKGENELPVLRDNLRKQDERLARQEQALTGAQKELSETKDLLKDSITVIQELRTMSQKSEERGWLRAKAELDVREAKAVSEGDTHAYNNIKMERDVLERTRPDPVATPAPAAPRVAPAPPPPVTTTPPQGTPDPATAAWVQANPWFTNDPLLNQVAIGFDMEVKREFPHWPVDDQLHEVKRRVVERFPEKFGNPRRNIPAAVSGSSAPAAPAKKGKTLKDLPKDAQEAFAKFQRMMPDYKLEDYMKLYFGEEA